MHKLTNWQKNIWVFKWNTVFTWFQAFVGVWVLIWTQYLDFTQIGLIYSLGLFFSVALELPSGALADLIGRKKTVLIGRVLQILSYIVFSFANNFWLFLVAQILYQANWALDSGAQSALLFDSLKENNQDGKFYKKTETDTFFLSTLGMVVGTAIGGFLFKYGTHLPFVICIFTSIIALVIALFFEEPRLDSEKFTFNNYLKQNIEGTKHIFENKKIRAITFFSLIISFITYTGLWYLYEPRLAEGGFEARHMGLLVAGTYLIRAVGIKLIPILDKKIKSNNIPYFLVIFQVIGSFSSFIQGRAGAITSVYSRKFLDGFRKPILNTLQNENIVSKYRATSLSAIALFENLIIASAGPIIGIMIDRYSASFTLGMFGFIGLVVGLPLARNLSKNKD
ncbi:MAG: MFS transporter [Candidatus Pacebacteria bacterium]|jgi:MFS family permease|nr:MFS transporter [Candidatus Paceibacterota bacterium]MBT3511592.1 MFS transporter [Candidatus Paceibacterota bacterium]MBT4004938.1 MFS transporter [Candidatus Paceibacterota bacterium]MBT4358714.1 MFS transporter [Candidatus Paceibacterota bacterium]MBT4680681.1 MFS transporter [Candidatus Paceibacterota bacterium]